MLKIIRRNKKAATIIEYSIMVGIVASALTAMSFYIRRAIQGRVKDMAVKFIAEDLYASGLHQQVTDETKSEANSTFTSKTGININGRTTRTQVEEITTREATDHNVADGWEEDLPP